MFFQGVFIKKLFYFLSPKNGFTLVEVLVATALLGVAAIGIMQLTKEQIKSKVTGDIDNDIIQASAQITSFLTHPAHCNANFSGLATGTNVSVDAVYSCPVGSTNNCRAVVYQAYGIGLSTGTRDISIPKIDPASLSWDQVSTKISQRVRISNLTYSVSSMTGVALATVTLDVTFQKKQLNGTITTLLPKKYHAAVVVAGAAIAGCPKTWNSTVVY